MQPRFLRQFTLAAALAAPLGAAAMELPVHYSVIEGWRQADGTHIAAVQINMDAGWHTYWRAPGDAGIPPLFELIGSENMVDFDISWPTPIVFDQGGMQSVGYVDQLILPVTFKPHQADQDIRIKGQLHIGVCDEICIPVSLDLDALLPADADTRQGTIAAALASVPYTADEASVTSAVCKIAYADGKLGITTQVTMPHTGGTEVAILESANPDHWLSHTTSQRVGDVLTSTASIVSMSGGPVMINRADMRITVLGSDYAVDIQGCTGS